MTGPSLYSEWKRKQAPSQSSLYDEWKRKQQPEEEDPERPGFISRSASALGEMASHPVETAKAIGKGLAGNARDLIALSEAGRGNLGMVTDEIRGEYEKGGSEDDIQKRLKLRALGAASLAIPTMRVGGVATSFLANTAANAGLGAAMTPDDPAVGATLGAVLPHAIPAAGRLAGKATGALARRAERALSPDFDLKGVLNAEVGRTPVRRTAKTPVTLDAADIAEVPLARLQNTRSGQQGAALDAHTVRPGVAQAATDEAFPEGYYTGKTRPEAEVEVVPQGADRGSKAITNPEVKAERVADERLDVAEQRDAESRMSKEVRALDKERVDAEQAAIKAADKAVEVAKRERERLEAKVAADADKAARTAEKAAMAAAKAAQRKADNDARLAAQAAGTTKQYMAQKRADRSAQLASDATEKAKIAEQAALDAAAKKDLASKAVETTKAEQPAAIVAAAPETAQGMLGVANAAASKQKRQAMAAQAVLARRRGVQPAAVVEPVVAPVEVPQPAAQPLIAPEGPLGAPLRPSNAPDIPEAGPTVTGMPVADAGGRGWTGGPGGADAPSMRPAEEPYLNYKTLGVDPSKPDALSTSTAARIDAMSKRPDIVERLKAERGVVSWSEGNQQAMESRVIQELGIDPLFADRDKMRKLSGHQIHALKPLLLENAGLMEGIAREMQDLSGDDLAHATSKLDALENSNAEILATIQGESARAGRDLNALKQVAAVTTDPAYWLVKAQRVLGDKPMTAKIQANIIKLAKEAAEACGGG